MEITPEEVARTAALAQLEVPEEESGRVLRALRSILAYVEKLREVDVSDVPPMVHAVPISLRLRSDEPAPQLSNEEALAGAPRRSGPFFEVPRIIEHEGEKQP